MIMYMFIITIILIGWDSEALQAIVNIPKQGRYGITEPIKSHFHDCALNQTQTDPPADVPKVISKTCHCAKGTRQCYTLIYWVQPYEPYKPNVTAYRMTFWEYEGDDDSKKCHRLGKEQRVFNFTGDGFTIDQNNPSIAFALTAEPVDIDTIDEHHHYLTCPVKLKILNNFQDNVHVNAGENFIFNCTFRGYPLPERNGMVWTFSNRTGGDETIVHDEHFNITKTSTTTTLTITNVAKIHEGRYTCHIGNYFGQGYGDEARSQLWVDKRHGVSKKNIFGPVLGIVCGIILLLILVFTLAWYLLKEYKRKVKQVNKQNIYISHCTPCGSEKEKLLKFAYCVESRFCGVTLIIDLTKETEISNAGGLSQWVPEQMSNADKILVVLSKEYLNALESDDNDKDIDGEKDEHTLKVLAEYRYITNLLHQSCQVTDKLIICWQGGKPETFPTIFEGRSCYSLPQITEETRNDSTFINLLSAITIGQDSKV